MADSVPGATFELGAGRCAHRSDAGARGGHRARLGTDPSAHGAGWRHVCDAAPRMLPGSKRWARAALLACALSFVVSAVQCAPKPRNVRCANDGECERHGRDQGFSYCLEGRCVKCIGNATCGDGNTCVDGTCVVRCGKDMDCPRRHVCRSGTCGPF